MPGKIKGQQAYQLYTLLVNLLQYEGKYVAVTIHTQDILKLPGLLLTAYAYIIKSIQLMTAVKFVVRHFL